MPLFSSNQANYLANPQGRTVSSVTASGNAKISTVDKKFGTSSGNFDGTNSYLTASTTNFGISTGDFTIEWWSNTPRTAAMGVLSWFVPAGNINEIRYRSTGIIDFRVNGTNSLVSSSVAISQNTWQHFALVRSGGTIKIYLDGTADNTTYNDTTNYGSYVGFYIGYGSFLGTYYSGYLDEIRVSKIARYTANFTPSASAFINDSNTVLLLHCEGANNSTTFTDDNS
jgi:hypothetical protein